MKIAFWCSLGFILYTYAGYPLWLALLRILKPEPTLKGDFEPTVSVVIAAHNEEKNIVRRVRDVLAQDYPSAKLEIIVVSDGSTDRTAEVLVELKIHNLKVLPFKENQGKAIALNAGVAGATGEVIIFTDARQTFAPGAIRNLARTFADPTVGCVSGELVFLKDAESSIQTEMGSYWKYEKWIRKAEGASGSVVGATGAIYAIRRSLYQPLPQGTLLDDLLTPLNIILQDYRCVFNAEAMAYDIISPNVSQEWRRKVRTLAGNWQLISIKLALLKPFSNQVWWRFISHKIFRLFTPFALILMVLLGILADGNFYHFCAWGAIFIFLTGAIGWKYPQTQKFRLLTPVVFFVSLMCAIIAGFWLWAREDLDNIWTAKRIDA